MLWHSYTVYHLCLPLVYRTRYSFHLSVPPEGVQGDLYLSLIPTRNCTKLNVVLYSNCNASHIKFCPIILRFISRSALGNLDNSSDGTSTLLLPCCCTVEVEDMFFCNGANLLRLLLFLWFGFRIGLKLVLFLSVGWFYGRKIFFRLANLQSWNRWTKETNAQTLMGRDCQWGV